MVADSKVLWFTGIFIMILILYSIFKSDIENIWAITFIILLSFGIVCFSISLIFDLGKFVFETYRYLDPNNFKYSDALTAIITILGLFGTGLSITLTYLYNIKKSGKE